MNTTHHTDRAAQEFDRAYAARFGQITPEVKKGWHYTSHKYIWQAALAWKAADTGWRDQLERTADCLDTIVKCSEGFEPALLNIHSMAQFRLKHIRQFLAPPVNTQLGEG